MSQLTEMNEQYGNSGYNQIDGYGANPYDQRNTNNNDGGRFNNYSEGRYDDRTSRVHPFAVTRLLTTP
jgi:syntaxin 1B/2/3